MTSIGILTNVSKNRSQINISATLSRDREPSAACWRECRNVQAKKNRPVGRFLLNHADYLAADAAVSAAVEAAADAAAAASAAVEAAAAAVAASAAAASAAGATVASAAGATVASAAGAVTSAAGATTGSSFFEQAARATAIRETISKDFFMGFP
ncbi:MAG: hypothetical protein ACXW2U_14855 [Telluria sp.]